MKKIAFVGPFWDDMKNVPKIVEIDEEDWICQTILGWYENAPMYYEF